MDGLVLYLVDLLKSFIHSINQTLLNSFSLQGIGGKTMNLWIREVYAYLGRGEGSAGRSSSTSVDLLNQATN
jgi:hypothetical protein